jgi:hypothetical protein
MAEQEAADNKFNSEFSQPEAGSSQDIHPIARFLLGAMLGVGFPLICLSYVWYFGSSVTAGQLWLLGTIAIGCGSCGVIWGNQFLAQLISMIENMPSL